jgi:hypothetical protein
LNFAYNLVVLKQLPTPDEVAQFLEAFKVKVNTFEVVFLNERPKNSVQTLFALGFSPANRRALLLDIQVADYAQGPLTDARTGLPLWVFGRRVNQVDLYIKIHMGVSGKPAVCVSFHEEDKDKDPLTFPYRKPTKSKTKS